MDIAGPAVDGAIPLFGYLQMSDADSTVFPDPSGAGRFLVRQFGDEYRDDRRAVRGLVPLPKRIGRAR